jgi:hypothetical protein
LLGGGDLVEDSDSDDDSKEKKTKPAKDAKTLAAEFDAEDEKLQSIVNLRKEQRDKVKGIPIVTTNHDHYIHINQIIA